MSTKPLSILLVEDSPTDAQILQDVLDKDQDGPFELQTATHLSEGLACLQRGGVDVVLLDLQLPDSRGIATLTAIRQQAPRVAVVVLTASDDEALALQALQQGAQDYLAKGYIQVYPKLLWRSMRYAIERQHSDEELRSAYAQTETILLSITSILIGVSHDGRISHWNDAAEAAFGLPTAQALGTPLASSGIRWNQELIEQGLERCRQAGHPIRLDEVPFTRPDGQDGRLGLTVTMLRGGAGGRSGFLLLGADITERARLESELAQAQKMETIGRFAGGIAHDFNNFLQGILGFALLIRSQHAKDTELLKDLDEIIHTSKSASDMVKQLLAFSRRRPLEAKLFDMNEGLRGLSRLLEQLVGDAIQVRLELATEPLPVKFDPGGLEQIVMNLASNAKHAMTGGGSLTFRTSRVDVDEATAKAHGGRPGRGVRLSVTDTGVGMRPEIAAHVFEPFFTTKGESKGTGLGLTVVYGLVRQHEGFIEVETAPGRGTTFHLTIPLHDAGAPASAVKVPAQPAVRNGRHRVLVVDDDASIRTLCERILRDNYEVEIVTGGADALKRLGRDAYDLLLTDLAMPGVDGFAVLEQAMTRWPGMRVLAMTGTFTQEVEERLHQLPTACTVMHKPFTPDDLRAALRRCLT